MSPEQQKYVIDNKLKNKEIYLLKKFRYIGFIITVVACIILSFYNQFFLIAMFVLVIFDILIAPKSMIIVDGEKIHEITNFSAKVYERSDYRTVIKYLFNKKSKAMYFTYALSNEQLNALVKKK